MPPPTLQPPPQHLRTAAFIAASAAFYGAALVTLTGGFQARVFGWRITATHPGRLLVIALALFALSVLLSRADWPDWLAQPDLVGRRLLLWLVPLLCLLVLAFGLRHGTYSAGGSDPYGYVSQAHALLHGRLIIDQPLAASLPWPEPLWTLSPLGYRPAPSGHAIVPTYASGLPIMMAAALALAGTCGPFGVGPVCAALLVLLAYLLGRRFGSDAVAFSAALLVATSPVFLLQAVSPMSDIPAAVAWAAALWLVTGSARGAPLMAGLLASAAILIRPNLALAALPIAWMAAECGPRAAPSPSRAIRRTGLFVAGLLPGVLLVAALDTILYGAPWRSGYGGSRDLYQFANVWPNLVRYPTWLVRTNTPFVLLGVLGLAFARRFSIGGSAGVARWLGPPLFVLVIVAQYLFYAPFEDWPYLRFLLPVWPLLMLFTAATLQSGLARLLPRRAASCLAVAASLALGAFTAAKVTGLGVLQSRALEQRYVDVAAYVATHTPADAVVVSMQHSGSLRFYAGRTTLRYDLLDPRWLDRAAAHLSEIGRHPYLVLEDWEIDTFRARFAATNAAGKLDWCPVAVLPYPVGVRFYDLLARNCSRATTEIPRSDAAGCSPAPDAAASPGVAAPALPSSR